MFALASSPRVLAVGESHALRGVQVDSVTTRFTRDLLPLLKGRASDLIVELMLPNAACQAPTEAVREQQQVVTRDQAPTVQNEYVTLGKTAQSLGLRADALRPSCDDLERIRVAGDDAVVEMLRVIARRGEQQVTERLAARHSGAPGMVVAYGGAMHNDLRPRPGHESFSFGPALQRLTDGRYVELDLVVREFVRDTPAWKELPWYGAYRSGAHQSQALLFRPGPGSFVLVFPASLEHETQPRPAAQGAGTGGRPLPR